MGSGTECPCSRQARRTPLDRLSFEQQKAVWFLVFLSSRSSAGSSSGRWVSCMV